MTALTPAEVRAHVQRRAAVARSAEQARLEHELALAKWRDAARRTRRYRRAIAVLERADSPLDWLLAPLRILKALLTSVPSPSRPAPPAGVADELDRQMAEARRQFDDGEDEPALSLARSLIPLVEYDNAAWRFVRNVLIRAGALQDHLRAIEVRLRGAPEDGLRRAQRKELGRLRELDTRWIPTFPAGASFEPVPGRVLHVLKETAPYLTNGYTMRSAYTVSSQQAAGLDPFVVTSLGFPRTVLDEVTPEQVSTDEVAGVRHHRLDLGAAYPYDAVPWDQLLEDTMTVVQPIVERERPELVQAGSGFRGIETALLGLAIARRYDLPFVYEVRSFLEHTWTGELHRAEHGEHFEARNAREVQLMLEADHVITIADSMKADLVARGVPADHISIVPNGVDTTAFVPRARDPQLAAGLGLPADVPVVGYVSNLGQREGLDVLIDAVLELRREGRSVTGLIIGEGPMRADLEARLAASGDPDAVLLPGRIPHDQIQEHYALIDVFVIPRLDDRAARLVTPLKPFEAMALERPMVVSDLPALREITAPDERGLVFTPGDPSSLAAQLRRLLDDPAERERIGKASRRWVEEERDWSMNGDRYRAVFDRVLHARARGA